MEFRWSVAESFQLVGVSVAGQNILLVRMGDVEMRGGVGTEIEPASSRASY